MSFSRKTTRALALLLVAVLAAGCHGTAKTRLGRLLGRAPQAKTLVPPPPAEGADRLLTGLPVLVAPTIGLSTDVDGRPGLLAAAVARNLIAADVLATTRAAASQSYVLTTWVVGQDLLADLRRPDGIPAGQWRIPLGAETSAITGPALDALALRIARTITGNTGVPAPAPVAAAPRASRISVVVGGVEGAPGDGNHALADAMRRALAIAGVRVPTEPEEGALVVTGDVSVRPLTPMLEHVVLAWEVRNPAGEVIATIAQENDVPAGSLNQSWGPIAGAAAQGGADGVLQLLDSLRR
ncbi:hypothetical protein L2U69_04310 [Zavarzinia compransoris]|uniref:hypothetical protein n=1 Tax=Zavarzinia marina TaxID=2911065 RepID=UPI001F278B9D|nr:hypothetical protein [Zavarzinia marina]MCF4164861.1 hypothetical protein [Zavarzinia marina]